MNNSGYNVIFLVRDKNLVKKNNSSSFQVDITDLNQMKNFGMICPKFDIVISCIASRTGEIEDAWNVEYHANKHLLDLGWQNNVTQFILLSAICVQKPKLEFQYAKLAFEKRLIDSPINHTIIRPTAFFKSLSGQIENLKVGKKFIYFDDGNRTSSKPISETDLAKFICGCINSKKSMNRIFPIGGPGPAMTPREIGLLIFKLLNQKPRFRSVPSKLFTYADQLLIPLSLFSKKIKNFRQFLKIANYYATESMLLYNNKTSSYNENLTPEYGQETLESHFQHLISSNKKIDELGTQKLF